MPTSTHISNKINRERGIVTVVTTIESTDELGNTTKTQTEEEIPLKQWEANQLKQKQMASSSPDRLHQGSSSKQMASNQRIPSQQSRASPVTKKSHSSAPPSHSSWHYLQQEFDIFFYMNLLRTNPRVFLPLLYERRKYYRSKLYKIPGKSPIETEEGVEAVEEAIEYLQKEASPLKEFTYSPGMSLGAREHIIDLGSRGLTGSQSTRHPHLTYRDRVDLYGNFTGHSVAEHISYGTEKPQTVVLEMLIDDGDKSRSHREYLFSSDWKYVGIAYGEHSKYGKMCVIDFCDEYEESQDVLRSARKPVSFINSTNLKLQDLEDVEYESVPTSRLKDMITRGPAPRQGGSTLFQTGYNLGVNLFSPYSKDLVTEGSLVDVVFCLDKDVDLSDLHIVNNAQWFEVKEYFSNGKLYYHGRLTNLKKGKLGILHGNSFMLRFNVE